MSSRLARISLWVLVACTSSTPSVTAPLPLPDDAERVASLLPPGADRCIAARPGLVPARHRSLLAPIAGANSIAWNNEAAIVAYAEAQQGSHRVASRILIKFADNEAGLRYLRDDAPLVIATEASDECESPWACWKVREVEGLVRLDFGTWDADTQGVRGRCAAMLRTNPRAYEVRHSFDSGALVADPMGAGRVPFEVVLDPLEQGVERRAHIGRQRGVSDDELILIGEVLRNEDELAAAYRNREQLRADGIHRNAGYLWEDLELARDDERRHREALAEEARIRRPVPADRVDVNDLARLRAQVELRWRRLSATRESLQGPQARELRVLLERGRQVHPDDGPLARMLLRVLLDFLRDGESASNLADEMLGRGVRDPEAWRIGRRRGLGLMGAEALRETLVEDGVATRQGAARAASMLAGFPGDYEIAEGAWLALQQSRRVERTLHRVRGVVPASALIDTLVSLVDPDGPSKSIHVIARVDAPLEVSAVGTENARVLTWPEGTFSWRVGADQLDAPDHLRGLTRGLFRDLPDDVGLEILLAAVPFGGSLEEPDGAIRVRARLQGGDLSVERASLRLDWEAVAHYLSVPFEGLETRLFPPPDLEVEMPDVAAAERLLDRASEEPVLRCDRGEATAGPEVSVECGASPQLDATRRAWRRVVWPWLGGRSITPP